MNEATRRSAAGSGGDPAGGSDRRPLLRSAYSRAITAGIIGTVVIAFILIFMAGCSAGISSGTKPGGDTSSEESTIDDLDVSSPSELVEEFTYTVNDGRVVTCLVYDGLGLSCDW